MIEKEHIGEYNANVLLADIATKVIVAPLAGVFCDRHGRRRTLFIGILLVSLAMLIMPFCSEVYPTYLVLRMFYAAGVITIVVVPLIADYIQDESKASRQAISAILFFIPILLLPSGQSGSYERDTR